MANQTYDKPGTNYDQNPDVGHDGPAAGDGSDPRGDLKNAEDQGSRYNPQGDDTSADSPSDLEEAEANAEDEDKYNDEGGASGSKKRRFLKKHKKKAAAGGGIAGLGVLGTILLASISQGPLQFVHLGELLQKYHFSLNYDATDSRASKLTRYIYYRSKGQVYKTNLGFFQNKYADRISEKLKAGGIESEYNKEFGYKEKTRIDSKFFGEGTMSPDELKAKFESKYPELKFSVEGDHLVVDHDNLKFFSGSFSDRSFERGMLQEIGYSKTLSVINGRVMSGRAGYILHPFHKLDRKALANFDEAYSKWKIERGKVIGEGKPVNAAYKAAKTDNPNDDPNAENPEAQKTADEGEAGVKQFQDSKALKTGFGVAAVTGVGCMLKSLDEGYDGIKQAEVIEPATRLALDALSTASQGQSGDDINVGQLAFMQKQLHGVDATGKKTNYNQAQSLLSEANSKDAGIEASKALKTIGQGSPFAFMNAGALGTAFDAACSTVGQIAIGAVSFLGGPVSTVAGVAFQKAFGTPLQNLALNMLSGEALPALVAGADYGNAVNYGARLAASSQMTSNGGQPISKDEETQLVMLEGQDYRQDFDSKNFIARTFDVNDQRSLVSKVIDQTSPDISENASGFAASLVNIGPILSKGFSSIIPSASAEDKTPYDYGFDKIGFSINELDSADVENPYKNADYVMSVILPVHPEYIERAQKCFAVTIDSTTYNVTPSSDETPAFETVNSGECKDKSLDWMKTRFYIFDNNVALSASCYEGDDTACSQIGVDSGSPETSGEAAPSETADTKIDMAHLYDSSVNVKCAANTKDLGVQDGYHEGAKVPIRVCAVESVPETGDLSTVPGADGKLVVNSRVSAVVVKMFDDAKAAGISPIQASEGFRTMARQQYLYTCGCTGGNPVAVPGTSNHQMGIAIDIEDGALHDWMVNNSEKYGFKWYGSGDPPHFSPSGT